MTRVVAGVVLRHGRVLACQRSMRQFPPGAWEFPGGKVEGREGDEAALVRELEEELGIRVRVGGILGTNVHDYGTTTIELVAYLAEIETGEPAPREHQAIRWVGRESLRGLEWAAADVPFLDRVEAMLG